MKTKILKYTAVAVLILFSACNLTPNLDMVGMFYGQSPRNNVRFEQSLRYNEEHSVCRTLTLPADEYKVYVATDMHIDSTWHNTLMWAEAAEADADAPFALVLGDVINAQGNYPHFLEAVKPLEKPWFCTAGNHDIYFGQWNDFLENVGSSTYYFVAQTPHARDLYICIDTSDATLGTKQLRWLRSLLEEKSKEGYRHIVVFTHTHMFKRDASQGHTSNFSMEETYELTQLLAEYGVEWYLSGHDHHREVTDFKGVKYIIVDTLQDPEPGAAYMIATIGDDMKYQFVEMAGNK
ncbi:MAG: metallophosphoesterase [Paludibacteraceae bacterium]|nr:metallophosphoesterase [Paludibacteraceae bacterium]